MSTGSPWVTNVPIDSATAVKGDFECWIHVKELSMNEGIKTLVVPVKDIEKAKTLYSTLLDVEPYTDEARYVGFRLGGVEVGSIRMATARE
jgi:hypothetical protein